MFNTLGLILMIGGFFIIVKKKVPAILAGTHGDQISGWYARLIGILLTLPYLLGMVSEHTSFIHTREIIYGTGNPVGIISVIIIVPTVVIMIRLKKQPLDSLDTGEVNLPSIDTESKIAGKAQAAIVNAVLSLTGLPAVIFSPLAIVFAGQALHLIDKNKVGKKYFKWSLIALIVATIDLLGVICVFIFIYLLSLSKYTPPTISR